MNPFHFRPARGEALPILVTIPHCGRRLVPEIESRFASPHTASLPMTDWHLHELYDFLPELGIATVFAEYSRYVVDLNRDPGGAALYPGRFETGLVPIESFDGEAIFSQPPDARLVETLRQRYHAPYHDCVATQLRQHIAAFGHVVLIDAHSVASGANRIHPALTDDIYLGDRDGSSCDRWLTDCVAGQFAAHGLRVSRNDPYKGGYTTAHYGGWDRVDALQIEMCQRLYMDEARPQQRDQQRWQQMQQCLVDVFVHLSGSVERI